MDSIQMPSTEQIAAFWDFFVRSAPFLERNFLDQEMHDELDRRIATLGPLLWELGPGTAAPMALVISPGGDADWLPVTLQIVTAAPSVPGWEFLPAKPPKVWDLQFELRDEESVLANIDARSWRYVLLAYDDLVFDLTIEAANAFGLDEDLRLAAVDVVLDGLLGEARRLQHIGTVDVVKDLGPDLEEGAGEIEDLKPHLDQLVTEGPREESE